MLTAELYNALHTQPLVPLNIRIDINKFRCSMEKYHHAFRRWGQEHLELKRFAVPLINRSGRLDDNPDPSIYPLDRWNENLSVTDKLWDNDFIKATEVLSEPCFDVLNPIKQHMVRSSIFKWHEGSKFYPHIDTWFPSPILRLWGTDCAENMHLGFNKTGERSAWIDNGDGTFTEPNNQEHAINNLQDVTNIESGRLYLIDTCIMHDARSSADNVHQFFIALNTQSVEAIKNLII